MSHYLTVPERWSFQMLVVMAAGQRNAYLRVIRSLTAI